MISDYRRLTVLPANINSLSPTHTKEDLSKIYQTFDNNAIATPQTKSWSRENARRKYPPKSACLTSLSSQRQRSTPADIYLIIWRNAGHCCRPQKRTHRSARPRPVTQKLVRLSRMEQKRARPKGLVLRDMTVCVSLQPENRAHYSPKPRRADCAEYR